MLHSPAVAAFALPLVLLAACGDSKSAGDVAEAHRKAAEPLLGTITALADAARAAAPVARDAIELPAGVTLDFIPYNNPAFNAGIAYAGELAAPCDGAMQWDADPARPGVDRSMTPPFGAAPWLHLTACLLAGKGRGETADMAVEAFDALAKIRYVLVLRPTVMQRPTVAGLSAAEVEEYTKSGKLPPARETFAGGRFAGDALLYEVATAKLLGAFAFAFESADKVEVTGSDHSEVASALLTDVRFGIIEQLGKLAPGTNIRP